MEACLTTKDAIQLTGLSERILHTHKRELGARVHRRSGNIRTMRFSRAKLEAFVKRRQALTASPLNTDQIFVADAEKLVKCSDQTLYRLARRGKLTLQKVQVRDAEGKAGWRTAFSRTELLSLFVPRPAKGQPIRTIDGTLPNGEEWYLRDDFKTHFGCSDIVLSYWRDKSSLVPKGNASRTRSALRTRTFYVIGERGRGCPKELTAWRGSDGAALTNKDSLERVRPRSHTSPWTADNRSAILLKAMSFMEDLKPRLPMRAEQAFTEALTARIPRWLVYVAKKEAGIKTLRRGSGEGKAPTFWWLRSGQTLENGSKLQEGRSCRGTTPATGPSNISSNNAKTKTRGPYKARQIAGILRLVNRHKKRGKPLNECFEETAAELSLKVGTVKMSYYRHAPAK